jgi:predicted DNA-binding ribbon-helix-helix protein
MKSPVVKRSIVLQGHKTSVSLEDEFWKGLKEIAGKRLMTLSALVDGIDANRQQGNLSSALRLFVLDFYRSQIPEVEGREGLREMLERPNRLLKKGRLPLTLNCESDSYANKGMAGGIDARFGYADG